MGSKAGQEFVHIDEAELTRSGRPTAALGEFDSAVCRFGARVIVVVDRQDIDQDFKVLFLRESHDIDKIRDSFRGLAAVPVAKPLSADGADSRNVADAVLVALRAKV